MKKLLLASAMTLLTVGAFAQGTINFANASSQAGWSPAADRSVKFADTAAQINAGLTVGSNVGSNYAGVDLSGLRAALYWAPAGTTDTSLFTRALEPAGQNITFKQSTSTTPGSWFSKTLTLGTTGAGIATGVASAMFAVVWDVRADASNPLSQAAKTTPGFLWGESAIFAYTPPSSGTPSPGEFLPQNLASFTIGVVPEPSTMALAGLAAASLLIFRRRK